MTKILDFKRCKAFMAMLLVLCQLFSIFGMAMPFTLDDAKAYSGGDEYCIKVRVHKLDAETKEYLPEAKLKIADADESSTRASWNSTDTYYEIEVPITEYGGWYEETNIAHDCWFVYELEAPEGYEIAEPVVIKTSDIDCLKNYTFQQNTWFEEGTPEYEANLANREAFYNAIENGEIPPSGELVVDVYVYNYKKTINNPSDKNDEPNKPLSTDNEVVNKGEDIEVTFNNHIHTVQNLTVSKVLKEELLDGNFGESLSEAEFNFKAYFSNMKEGDTFTATKSSDPDAIGAITADANGEAEFSFNLKNKESIVFNEMPVNVQYQIEEILEIDNQDGTLDMDYEPAYLVSGLNTVSHTATGNRGENLITGVETLEAREEGSVIFTNTKKMDYGKLVVQKKVENNENSNEEFEFTITLTGENISGTQVINDVTFVDGVAKIYLKNGESKEFDLPDGTTYKVEEAEYQNYDTSYSEEVIDPNANIEPVAGGSSNDQGMWLQIQIEKVDQDGNPVIGAHLQLNTDAVDWMGHNISSEWVTDGNPYVIDYYEDPDFDYSDCTFTLHEASAPEGYKVANDIAWGYYDEIYEITMVDEKIPEIGEGEMPTPDAPPVSPNHLEGDIIKDVYKVVTVTNTYKVGKLVVTKEVVGNEDTQQSFQFTITLTGDEIGGKQTFNGVEFNDGVGVIYLKNGESKEFDLPDGTTYKVEETQYESYDASYSEEVIDPYVAMPMNVLETYLTVHKVDENGNYVEGAVLQLIDTNGEIREEWTTSNGSHEIWFWWGDRADGYVLHEVKAPEGYKSAEDIVIDTRNLEWDYDNPNNDDGVSFCYKISMIDKTISYKDVVIHKVDNKDDYVQGATLQLINASTYEVVDEWVTDNTPHTVTVDDAYNYIVREVSAPEGYTPASDITFNPKETTEVTMINVKNNKNVTIKKVDKNDAYVQGATLQVLNASTNEVVAEWVSGNGEYIVSLDPDYSYILHEASAPGGYELAEDITFNPNEATEVTMVNNKIKLMFMRGTIERDIYKVVKVTNTYIPTEDEVAILKVDSDNNPLAGATLQIIDADGNVVDEWVSTNEEHRISLVYGTYTLHEAKAPRGYRLAEDIEFTVAEGSYNTVIMVDPPISVMVSTGGTGTIITIALAVVFGCATGFLVYMGKKKEKEEAQASENSDNKETKNE